MTLNQAVIRGIARVRKAHWKDPLAYLFIGIIKNEDVNSVEQWCYLFSPMLHRMTGENSPQLLSIFSLDRHLDDWVEYSDE